MKRLLCAVSIMVFLLFSCQTNKVSIVRTNFEAEIDLQQNLSFKFDKDIAPESMLNKWDTASYISFTPNVNGRFQWISPSELVFSPESGFHPATKYEAKLNKEIANLSEQKISLPKSIFEFQTPDLKLEAAKAYWGLSAINGNDVIIGVDIAFNYPVSISNLDENLKVFVGDYIIPHKIISSGESDDVSLEFNPPAGIGAEEIPLKIVVEENLFVAKTDKTIGKQQSVTASIPVRSKLMVSAITNEMVQGEGTVNIFFTQPILNDNFKDLITVKPNVAHKIDVQNNIVRLIGDFEEDKTYEIRVKKAVRSVLGASLENDYTQSVSFSKSKPYISFANGDDNYLSSRGNGNVGISLGGVETIKVSVFKIFENNIIHYLRKGKSYDYYWDDSGFEREWYDFYEWQGDADYGMQVYEKTLESTQLPLHINGRLLHLDINELNRKDPGNGIYVVAVQDAKRRWLRDAIMVSISDIGVIAKFGKNSALIATNSILDATPLEGVNVDFISTNNQKIHSAKTSKDGFLLLENTSEIFKKFRVGMLTLRHGNDFNYIYLDHSNVETSRYEVGGKYTNASDFDVFIYGDRKLYRPGDSVHINTIIRTLDWETPKDIPLKFRVVNPSGRHFSTFRKTTNNEGASAVSFKLPDAALTGSYTVEVYSGNDVLYNSYRILCEEFMPDRLSVTVKSSSTEMIPKDNLKLDITAENFFGTPATNREVECEMRINTQNISPKKYSDYRFNISIPNSFYFDNVLKNTKTDKDGKASVSFQMPANENIGMLSGRVYTAVFDENNRPVNRHTTFKISTQSVYFGLRHFDYYVPIQRNMKFAFVALDKNEKLVNGAKARVKIVRNEYQSSMARSGSSYSYLSNKREIELVNKDVSFSNGKAYLDFVPPVSGEYEIKIYVDDKAKSYVGRKFWSYGSGTTDYSSFEVDKEGEILIETDKEEYLIGDKAEILFKCPFSGKLIVTIERDNIIDYKVLEIEDKAAKLSLPIEESYMPNVYISATAIRPLVSNEIPLTVAHGYSSVIVSNPNYKMDVQIKSPKQSLSRTKQTVEVSAEAGSQLTIAVVDEGILQMNNYQTPNPFEYFFQKRALEVDNYDFYAKIFPELKRNLSSWGGDIAMEMGKRVNPFTNKRVRLISHWSGIVKNITGKVSYSFEIPQFSGSLRVMAVAWKGKKFGSAETNLIVADPIVISTALPRFLTPDDLINIPVTLSNTTKTAANVVVKLNVQKSVSLLGKKEYSLSIPANSERRVMFNARVNKDIGEALFTTSVEQGGKTFKEEIYVPIRPTAGFVKHYQSGVIDKDEDVIRIGGNFLKGSVNNKLIVSKSPITEFTKNISELLSYPYGCLEQITSVAFPLLYYRDIAQSLNQDNQNMSWNPDFLVQETIHKIQSMQRYSGAMTYWPGTFAESWWGTAYATHFLIEAHNAGFEVRMSAIRNAVDYLERESRTKKMKDYYYYNSAGRLSVVSKIRNEIPYSLYVSALAGSKNTSRLNYYKDNYKDLTQEGKYLLAAAFALSGNKSTFRDLLPARYTYEDVKRETDGSFGSTIRNNALVLNTIFKTDRNNPQILPMASKLSNDLKRAKWLSTQDKAFALLALGSVAAESAKSDIKASFTHNNRVIVNYNNENQVSTKDISNSTVNVKKSGSGKLYYFYEAEGFSKDGKVDELDNNIVVRRSFFDRSGNKITNSKFKSNDLIIVRIGVASLDNSTVENVAICDMLPACFEIENPRIGNDREYAWIKDKSTPTYTDIRDDQITFFTSASSKIKYFYYMVRVVSSGRFNIGVVSADAMYDGNYYSYNGTGVITVQ